jgi:hypothetical protein
MDDAPTPVTVQDADVTGETQVSRLRRAVFAYTTTFTCIGCTGFALFLKLEGPLAERAVSSLMNYAELMAMLYLGAGVLDRSRLLDKLGERFNRGGKP